MIRLHMTFNCFSCIINAPDRQQAIGWANVDQYLCRHSASLASEVILKDMGNIAHPPSKSQ